MVAGAGVSMAMPGDDERRRRRRRPSTSARPPGVNSTLRELGGVFGIAITVAVFAGAGGYASFADGFERALLVASGLSLAGAVCAVALPSRRSAARSASLAASSIARA